MRALQSALARKVLQSVWIPLQDGAIFTYADKEYTVYIVPKATRRKRESFWKRLLRWFNTPTNSKGSQ